jgi:hypothetical protein
LGSLFEPRHEQNLYANPKRTAKSFICYICIDAVRMQMVQKKNKYFLARSTSGKIAKNFRACPELSHPRQRRTALGTERLAQRRFLASA